MVLLVFSCLQVYAGISTFVYDLLFIAFSTIKVMLRPTELLTLILSFNFASIYLVSGVISLDFTTVLLASTEDLKDVIKNNKTNKFW